MAVREAIGRVMKPAGVRARQDLVDRAIREALAGLAGRPFDPVEVTWEVGLRSALPVCAGEPTPDLVPVLLASSAAGRGLVDAAIRVPRWWPSAHRRRIRAANRRVRAEVARLMADDRPESSPPSLVDVVRRTGGRAAGRVVATGLLSAIPAAGGAWCWLLRELGRHPDEVRLLRREAAAGGDLPHTTAFVREVLRLHPPAWLLGRNTSTPLELAGAAIPVGTSVLFSPYLLHRDPRWWDEPGRFSPRRWSGSGAPDAYLPFGAGPRVCTGAHLALTIMVRTAAHLVSHYDLAVEGPTGTCFGSVLLPTGMRCSLTPRIPEARSPEARRPSLLDGRLASFAVPPPGFEPGPSAS
ncbi:cytochrome P450 [Saccharothrix syringae]|uniref:Cytochrome P450 n=2 Tax=Saccharothrix syringae TaxID=103733 RepID=A0A5Q0HEH6_SACSY|nr:cytochrome P450 [Saccharothrix syringae]